MADETQESRTGAEAHELRHVNWRELFAFTHLFKSFKLSRHMTKIVIALAAVILTWGLGRVLDVGFGVFGAGAYNQDALGEPDAYWCVQDFGAWRSAAKDKSRADLIDAGAALLTGQNAAYKDRDAVEKAVDSSERSVRGKVRDALDKKLSERLEGLKKDNDTAQEELKKENDADVRKKKGKDLDKQYLESRRATYQGYVGTIEKMDRSGRQGLFDTFADFEGHYFRQAIDAVMHGDIFSGFGTLRTCREGGQPTRLRAAANAQDPVGLLAALTLMGYGILWLAASHWVYAILFFLPLLVIWSVAGGAISRAAALQATRDEKAGIGECVKFGIKKLLSFVASPLVPVAVLLGIGLLTALFVGLAGTIPWFGGLWLGVFFGLALLAGVVMALLLIGLVAGGLLMAPTIAVEGSDTFDACTRSYQFVLARPWRATLYGLVAAGYGTLCYYFVRFLLFLALLCAHWSVGIFAGIADRGYVREGASKWDLIWPSPTFEAFNAPMSPAGVGGADWVGGWMVHLWVMLVAAILVAWVVSYLFSASTMVYLLLRKAEDATDLNEVFVEEPAEEPAAAAAAAPSASAGPAAPDATPPAPAAPAAPAPGDTPPPTT